MMLLIREFFTAAIWGGLQRFLRERGIEAVNRRGSLVLRDRPGGKGMRSERLGLAYSQAALMSRLGRAERQEFVVRRSQVENLMVKGFWFVCPAWVMGRTGC